VRQLFLQLVLSAIQAYDRFRLARLAAAHPGVEIHPRASTNLASASFELAEGASLRIGPGVVTERRHHGVRFCLGPGARVSVGADTWIRSDLGTVQLYAFPGAEIEVGPDCFLNGCHLSSKSSLRLGRSAWVGPGSRVFDSDQHDLDAEHPEVTQPVVLGDYTWVAADVTVLRGVVIGSHSVIGARSLVTQSIPEHTLAFGIPARPRGEVGDRSEVPI
jgi:acetyltransferase-like isoleucine patch superfamily enzyme